MKNSMDPCSPCVCSSRATCEQCMFGYKSKEEQARLLKEVLEENKYEGIINAYNFYHNR